jgi:hypothetical protein
MDVRCGNMGTSMIPPVDRILHITFVYTTSTERSVIANESDQQMSLNVFTVPHI